MKQPSFRPAIESCEARSLMSVGVIASVHHVAVTAIATSSIASYRVFHGTVPIGHGRTLHLDGPILLGPTDARGQVIGALYLADGSTASVVGLVFGGGVSLQITTYTGRVLHASGSGHLGRVQGGFRGYDSLFGGGNLSPSHGPFVVGRWQSSASGT